MNQQPEPTLEERFIDASRRWGDDCGTFQYNSMNDARINSDAYREIVSMGKEVLPLIKREMTMEYGIKHFYEEWLKRLKIAVLGNSNMPQTQEMYTRLTRDPDYKFYEEHYITDVQNKPGIVWHHAVREIEPNYSAEVSIVGLDEIPAMHTIIEWLHKNGY